MQFCPRAAGRKGHDALGKHCGLPFGPDKAHTVAMDVGLLHLKLRQKFLEIQHGEEVAELLGERAEPVTDAEGHFLARGPTRR